MVLSDNGMESYVFPVADLNGAAKPEQSKTVNITANGTQTVTPDSGKVLSSVVINTNVPAPTVETQEKSVEITQNGDSEVTPDAGKYLSKVNISVNVSSSTGSSKFIALVDGSITEVTADDLAGATKIGTGAFYACNALTSVTIPEGVTSIGSNAFAGCVALTSVTIPSSVTSINVSGLKIGSSINKATITMLSTTPPRIQSNTFTATTLNQIIVPAGCGDAYKAATNWANFADYIVEATA